MKKIIYFLLFLVTISPVLAKSGSMTILAVSNAETDPKGSTASLFLEVKPGQGRVFIDSFPLSKVDTQISTRFAKEIACNFLERDCSNYDFFYTIRSNTALVGGPSASAAIAVLTVAVLDDLDLDKSVSITGTINSGGIIGPVGGILPKIQAASYAGINTVLIPKYSKINESNLTEYAKRYHIDIIEVSRLSEAIYEFTGKEYSEELDVEITPYYIDTMKQISIDLCNRASLLRRKINASQLNTTAIRLLNNGFNAIENEEYYSAASYCFGSSMNLRNKELLQLNLSDEQIRLKIVDTLDRVSEYKNYTENQKLRTITDLETYMAVTDRLLDSREHLQNAIFNLAINNTNTSIYELASGIERLNSARSWSGFFGKPGKTFDINQKVLQESCLRKISEVEERIQYIELYLPTSTQEIRQDIEKSYEDYNSGQSELCLYKSSIAKAKVDLVLNNLAIDIDQLDNVIEDRSEIVESIIAKQSNRGVFPILSYSYYEYANSLKNEDKYSALLYLEYALELGTLDIYFEKEKVELPVSNEILTIFILGLISGLLLGISFTLLTRKIRR